jgi:hypothetical protein
MTSSNGFFNPNPLANPFNTRLGPSNISFNPANPSFSTQKFVRNPNASLPMRQSFPKPSPQPAYSSQLGGLLVTRNGNRLTLTSGTGSSEWNDRELMTFDVNRGGLSSEDIAYASKIKKLDDMLRNSMTDEQKKLLADVEAGKYIQKPKLVEVPD